jgi:maleate isomerase
MKMEKDVTGWRAKVGLLLPSVNSVVEPWFYQVAPRGITFHSSRMMLGKEGGAKAVEKMIENSFRAAQEVACVPVDLITYCCTAATLVKGPAYDKELTARLKGETGIPAITATESILKAFQAFGVKKIVITGPYTKDIDELEKKYFEACGYKVLRIEGMNLGAADLDKPSPEEIYRFSKKNWNEEADCLLISCLNFRAQACIEALEQDLKRPVITSLQAVLWNILRTVQVNEPIPGYGKLLAEF